MFTQTPAYLVALLVIAPEGWDGEGGGRGFRRGNTCTPMADSCQCIAKTTTIL